METLTAKDKVKMLENKVIEVLHGLGIDMDDPDEQFSWAGHPTCDGIHVDEAAGTVQYRETKTMSFTMRTFNGAYFGSETKAKERWFGGYGREQDVIKAMADAGFEKTYDGPDPEYSGDGLIVWKLRK